MDVDLKEYLDSLEDKEISIDYETPEGIKEIEKFTSVVSKTEENFVDFVRHIHFTARDSIIFKNAGALHYGAIKMNKVYKGYYKRSIDLTDEFSKKFKT